MKLKTVLFYVLLLFYLFCYSVSPGVAHPVEFSAPETTGLGEPFLFSLESSVEISELQVCWQKRTFFPQVQRTQDGYEAILVLGTDTDDVLPGNYLLQIRGKVEDQKMAFSWQVRVNDKSYPVESLNVENYMVIPPEEVLSRIKRERAEIGNALNTDTFTRKWIVPFIKPVEGDCTSSYGKKRFFNGLSRGRHGGVDLRAKNGTPVKAVSDGTVILTGDHYFSGKSVYLDHGNGLISMYFHLSQIKVSSGQKIRRGEVVALSGATGRVTGPHLHFGVSIKGEMVDPAPLFTKNKESFICSNRTMTFNP